MDRIFEVNDMYIDNEQLKGVVGYFLPAPDLEGASLLAQMIGERIQLFSKAKLLTQRLLVDNEAASLREMPTGTIKRRLHIVCQAAASGSGLVRHLFEIIIFDPVDSLLDEKGLEFDPTRQASIDFIQNVLSFLSDIHGHPFERVIRGWIEQ